MSMLLSSRPDPNWLAAAQSIVGRSLTAEEQWRVQQASGYADVENMARSWGGGFSALPGRSLAVPSQQQQFLAPLIAGAGKLVLGGVAAGVTDWVKGKFGGGSPPAAPMPGGMPMIPPGGMVLPTSPVGGMPMIQQAGVGGTIAKVAGGAIGKVAGRAGAMVGSQRGKKVRGVVGGVLGWWLIDAVTGAILGQTTPPKRTMNPFNPRALARADKRICAFSTRVRPVLRSLGYQVSSTRKGSKGCKTKKKGCR